MITQWDIDIYIYKIIEKWIFYKIFYGLCKIKKLFQAS